MAESIHPVSIVTETKDRYLIYALSVVTSRALPDVRDGLKPVQRRILYTMYQDLRLHADAKPRKCSKIAGDVMGNYHPHGDAAIYEALVRLAQDWVLRYPLVYGHGNFGSVDGDAAASPRYTEARLTGLSDYLMSELRQQTVDMRDNYDATTREPTVLPARFPNLLVNGTAGIAVGMATNIPPHNLGEVVRAAVHLIDEPEATTAQLLDRVKGPDFPLGGRIVSDRASLRKIYEEGSGSIKVQGEWKEEQAGKKQLIVITSIPYGVNKGNLESAIGEIIAARKLPQVLDLANESNAKEGLRIALEVKPGTDSNLVMAYLYKHTDLQQNFSYNMTCLVPAKDEAGNLVGDAAGNMVLRPERLGLKAILREFLDFRFATVRRRFEYDLEQLRRRIHILEGFAVVFDALDKAIKLIRESSGRADAMERLMKAFKLDEVQAAAVVDAQLYKIAQMEIQKIIEELKEKKAAAAKIEAILNSKKKLWGVVKDELVEVGEKFAERRRTRMASAEDTPDFDPEAYIVRENTNVVLTRDGWVKRVGRLESVDKTRVREGDEVIAVVPGSTLDHVVFFADDGTAYTMRMNEVPASSGYGEPLTKYFKLADQVKVLGAVTTDPRFTPADEQSGNGEPGGPYLVVVTAQGQALRTPLAGFRTASNKLGRRFVKLNEGDKVVMARLTTAAQRSIFLASAAGHVLHFPIEEINILAGVGKGVMGIKLEKKDTCLGGALIHNQNDALVVETSGGKTMEFHGSRELTGRGGKGFEAVKRTSFVRVVPPPIELVDWDKVEGKEEKNGKGEHKAKEPEKNGDQPTLFE